MKEKIHIIGSGWGCIGFIENIKDYVLKNYRITPKQMESLNKIYKELND